MKRLNQSEDQDDREREREEKKEKTACAVGENIEKDTELAAIAMTKM